MLGYDTTTEIYFDYYNYIAGIEYNQNIINFSADLLVNSFVKTQLVSKVNFFYALYLT